MRLLIETVCLRLTNPVFIWLEGISWDFDTSPDFLSNCSFYGLVIDLITEHVFKRSTDLSYTSVTSVCTIIWCWRE